MCGIAGFVHFGQGQQDPDMARRFVSALRHRGPDEDGIFDHPAGVLAMARLSIQDPESGKQPYLSPCGQIAAIFNGEIYNFQEHLDRYSAQGWQFKSRADGEVLIPLYQQFGLDLFDHLRGMFAFALLDLKENRLLIGRDPMGVKPLYYALPNKGGVVFGSETRAVFASGLVPAEIDRDGLHGYLAYDGVPCPRTLFKGIHQLPGGHALILEKGKSPVTRAYHQNTLSRATQKRNPVEVMDELEHHLHEATRLRLVADVPVGLFVSGGLDSTAVTLMALKENPQLEAFFVAVKGGKGFDDSHVLGDLAQVIGKMPSVIEFGLDDIDPTLTAVSRGLDMPLGDASLLPTFVLSREARKRVTVALTGDGADEVLGGYPTYKAHRLWQQHKAILQRFGPMALKVLSKLPASSGNLRPDYLLKRFLNGAMENDAFIRHGLWMGSWTEQERTALVGNQSPGFYSLVQEANGLGDREENPVAKAMLLDQRLYLMDVLLVKADRASMLNGLELRSPFLDRNLVAFASGLPLENLMQGKSTKKPLRDLLEKYGAGRLAQVPKKGFGIPVANWLKLRGGKLMEGLLKDGRAVKEGWVTPAPGLKALEDHLAGREDRRKELYTLLALLAWVEEGAGQNKLS